MSDSGVNLKEWAAEQGVAYDCPPVVRCGQVEHRDRFAGFGAPYVEAALSASGRTLLVVDPGEDDDDLVRDVTEILTSLCARLYGKRAAANRAARALAYLDAPDVEGVS